MPRHLIGCKNCEWSVTFDPTDSESYVHYWTGDAQCQDEEGNKLDSWAEPAAPLTN